MGVAVLVGVSIALTVAANQAETLPGDVALARWIQSAPEPVGPAIGWLGYWIGSAAVVVGLGALLAAGLWVRGRQRLAAFALGIVLLRLVNPLLKGIVASQRPTDAEVFVTELAGGYGFPSGHVMGATLLYGGIVWLASRTIADLRARRVVQATAMVLIAVTAVGRVETGAHWPSDVLGGLLWGAIGVLVLAYLNENTGLPGRSGAVEAWARSPRKDRPADTVS